MFPTLAIQLCLPQIQVANKKNIQSNLTQKEPNQLKAVSLAKSATLFASQQGEMVGGWIVGGRRLSSFNLNS